jgi:predicted NBD/HSP70 family sugar kinase
MVFGGYAMRTGDTELVRAINRFHVMDAVRRLEPVSRAEIGEQTRLGRTTVSAILGELLTDGVVYEIPGETRKVARGRPRELLRMNPNRAFVVGVKLSMHQISIAVTNLRADPLASVLLPVRSWRLGPEHTADLLEDGVRAAVARANLSLKEVAGVGVGVPGFIDAAAGVSHWSPILGDAPVPFADLLTRRLGVPTTIENDANLVTLAERWFGHGQGLENFVVITLDGGIGMGLFVNGEPYSGQHGVGAEFGHMKIDRAGPLCRCGQHGCIEAFAGDYAILREAAKILDVPAAQDEAEMQRQLDDIARRARDGDARLLSLFRQVGEILGLGVANLINIIDPQRVVVTGVGMRAADLIEPSLRAAVQANALAAPPGRCDIVFHDWTDEVWSRGAAALILQTLYRKPWAGGARAAGQAMLNRASAP